MNKIWTGLVVLVLGIVGIAPSAGADGGTANVMNFAHAVNGRGGLRADLDWQVAQAFAGKVMAKNRAAAMSTDCTGCQAAAVALQIVFASGINTVQADNGATSLNYACDGCDTQASAEQFVVASPGQVVLSPAGWTALDSLHTQFQALYGPGATPESITTGALAIGAQVATVLNDDVSFAPLGYHVEHRWERRFAST